MTRTLLPHYRPHASGEASDAVMVLQRGPNPSTDYYLRPRLERMALPWRIVDLKTPPGEIDLMARGDGRRLWVIFCRYASGPWLTALEALGPRLARTSVFADDDLLAGLWDPSIPWDMRAHWALYFRRHAARMGRLANEVWVSTPRLAARYAHTAVVSPVPEADPPPPAAPDCRLVCYHSTQIHAAERAFAVAVIRAFPVGRIPVRFEITGDARMARALAGLSHVEVVPERPWPDYLAAQAGRGAAVFLAPMFDSQVNAARAPVKAFDAARLGAAGLFADVPPYADFIRDGQDGRLVPMQVEAWVAALSALMQAPDQRRALAVAGAARAASLRRAVEPFPEAGAAGRGT